MNQEARAKLDALRQARTLQKADREILGFRLRQAKLKKEMAKLQEEARLRHHLTHDDEIPL